MYFVPPMQPHCYLHRPEKLCWSNFVDFRNSKPMHVQAMIMCVCTLSHIPAFKVLYHWGGPKKYSTSVVVQWMHKYYLAQKMHNQSHNIL